MDNEPMASVERVTNGVRVRATPLYVPDHSDPRTPRYVFAYTIRITNERPGSVQLLWRRWTIEEGDGRRREIRGQGVVGEQPTLTTGESFEYQSFCPLSTSAGMMEGAFTFQAESGAMFETPVGPMRMAVPDGDGGFEG